MSSLLKLIDLFWERPVLNYEEVAFPQVAVEFESADLEKFIEQFPAGDGCCNCIGGCARGMQYFDWAQVEENLTNESFRQAALACSDAHASEMASLQTLSKVLTAVHAGEQFTLK